MKFRDEMQNSGRFFAFTLSVNKATSNEQASLKKTKQTRKVIKKRFAAEARIMFITVVLLPALRKENTKNKFISILLTQNIFWTLHLCRIYEADNKYLQIQHERLISDVQYWVWQISWLVFFQKRLLG